MEVVRTAPEVATEPTAAGSDSTGSAGPADFDVVIIGGGPGGYATALYGAAAGLTIAVVELDKVGGTCLHRGCVPAKEFLETAAVVPHGGRAAEFGIPSAAPASAGRGRLRRQPGPQAAGGRPAVPGDSPAS